MLQFLSSFIHWCADNWQGIVSIISCLLGTAIYIAHQAHADAAATTLQDIQNALGELTPSSTPQGNITPVSPTPSTK